MSVSETTTEASAKTRDLSRLHGHAVGVRPCPRRAGLLSSAASSGTCTGWPTAPTGRHFLTTSDGVVILDAPPTIGHNIQRAVDEIASANGVSNKVTRLVYSHHHRPRRHPCPCRQKRHIGHEETRRLLLRDDDPSEATERNLQTAHLEIGGERIDLAWHGANHSPDNIVIHLPDHDTLMLIDIVNPGWAPVYVANLTEDIPGYIEDYGEALAYSWKHFIGGHLGEFSTATT